MGMGQNLVAPWMGKNHPATPATLGYLGCQGFDSQPYVFSLTSCYMKANFLKEKILALADVGLSHIAKYHYIPMISSTYGRSSLSNPPKIIHASSKWSFFFKYYHILFFILSLLFIAHSHHTSFCLSWHHFEVRPRSYVMYIVGLQTHELVLYIDHKP